MIISGKTKLAGVLGWPVSHSRSPRLHGYWLDQAKIDGVYLPLPVRSEDFARVLQSLPQMGFVGANVTLPHKEHALSLVDLVEPLAARIGAVNTLLFHTDGSIEGRNTDAFGFLANLQQNQPKFHAHQAPAVILGAGGAARAVLAALVDGGAPEIRLVNRNQDRAQQLADQIGGPVRVVSWDERAIALAGAGLLVNTTSLGMTGHLELELDLTDLPGDALVNDIVYAPLHTDLLVRAAKRGNPVVDGLGMLLHQARPGFAAWFGPMPEVTPALRKFVEEA